MFFPLKVFSRFLGSLACVLSVGLQSQPPPCRQPTVSLGLRRTVCVGACAFDVSQQSPSGVTQGSEEELSREVWALLSDRPERFRYGSSHLGQTAREREGVKGERKSTEGGRGG